MTGLRNWFLALSRREQLLIGGLAAILTVVIAIYGIILPLDRALDDARTRYSVSLAKAVQVETKVRMLREPENRPAAAAIKGPIEAVVVQSAEAKGFVVENLTQQGGDRVTLSIPSAKPRSLYGWLAELEQRGLRPDSVTIAPQSGDTVSVQLSVSGS